MNSREHWLSRVQPLGRSRIEVAYRRTFSPAEAERLRAGSWPQSQDDRWVVQLGEGSLDLWRSWTGHCIYSLPAQTTEVGVTVGPLRVNGDSQQYRRVGDEDDVRLFESIIGSVLRS
jgi:hypothetical protein